MVDYIKISELPAASAAALTDQLETNQAGTSRSLTVAQLLNTPTSGSLIQHGATQTGTMATGTTIIPYDNTIPQIGEGTQFMTLAFTPKSATSRLVITVNAQHAVSVSGALIGALFRDAVANALAVGTSFISAADGYCMFSLIHTMTSGTTSSITFRYRAGSDTASTVTFNGIVGAARFGGTMASTITIQEIAA